MHGDGQRPSRVHGEREIKALKIQTVRWRQTQTLMTEIEGSNKLGLFLFLYSLRGNFMNSGRGCLWCVET